MCVYLGVCVCVCVWLWRLNPIELRWDEKHMQHIMVALHSLQHQWCPLFYHQSLGTSLFMLLLPYDNQNVAFNTKAVLMTTMLFEIVAPHICGFFFLASPDYDADKWCGLAAATDISPSVGF